VPPQNGFSLGNDGPPGRVRGLGQGSPPGGCDAEKNIGLRVRVRQVLRRGSSGRCWPCSSTRTWWPRCGPIPCRFFFAGRCSAAGPGGPGGGPERTWRRWPLRQPGPRPPVNPAVPRVSGFSQNITSLSCSTSPTLARASFVLTTLRPLFLLTAHSVVYIASAARAGAVRAARLVFSRVSLHRFDFGPPLGRGTLLSRLPSRRR